MAHQTYHTPQPVALAAPGARKNADFRAQEDFAMELRARARALRRQNGDADALVTLLVSRSA